MSKLHAVAHKMVEKGKGILAADESTPTCTKPVSYTHLTLPTMDSV